MTTHSKDYLGYTISVEAEQDDMNDAPWDNDDSHGPVSEWRPEDSKRPDDRLQGQQVLRVDVLARDGIGRIYRGRHRLTATRRATRHPV